MVGKGAVDGWPGHHATRNAQKHLEGLVAVAVRRAGQPKSLRCNQLNGAASSLDASRTVIATRVAIVAVAIIREMF